MRTAATDLLGQGFDFISVEALSQVEEVSTLNYFLGVAKSTSYYLRLVIIVTSPVSVRFSIESCRLCLRDHNGLEAEFAQAMQQGLGRGKDHPIETRLTQNRSQNYKHQSASTAGGSYQISYLYQFIPTDVLAAKLV